VNELFDIQVLCRTISRQLWKTVYSNLIHISWAVRLS